MSLTQYLGYRTAGSALHYKAREMAAFQMYVDDLKRALLSCQEGHITPDEFQAQLVAEIWGLPEESAYTASAMIAADVFKFLPEDLQYKYNTQPLPYRTDEKFALALIPVMMMIAITFPPNGQSGDIVLVGISALPALYYLAKWIYEWRTI